MSEKKLPDYSHLFHKVTGGKPEHKSPLRPDLVNEMQKKPPQMQKFVYQLKTMVTDGLLDTESSIELDYVYNQLYEQLELSFKGWLWGESLGQARIVYPADWWQAFKERWFPSFLRDRYPIIYSVREIDVKAIYPRLRNRMLYPEVEHVIHVEDKGYDLDEFLLEVLLSYEELAESFKGRKTDG